MSELYYCFSWICIRSVLLAKMTHQPKHDLDIIHHKSSLYVCLVDLQYNCLCLGILMYGLVYPMADLGLLNGGFKKCHIEYQKCS